MIDKQATGTTQFASLFCNKIDRG